MISSRCGRSKSTRADYLVKPFGDERYATTIQREKAAAGRSSLVNLKSIAFLERRSHGEFEIVRKDGTRVMLRRNYRAEVQMRLGQSL